MKTLYFIRHGIAEHNLLFEKVGKDAFYDKRYYDTKLTPKGHEQSIHLGNTWNKIHEIDLVLCSSLSRTLETARNIFSNTSIPIIALDILKEHPQGMHTCNKRTEKKILIERFPEINFSEIIDNEDTMWCDTKEETLDELNQRIDQFNQFLQTRDEKNIAIVGHNSFIGTYKDKKIGHIENGDEELLHCYPYQVLFKL